MSDWIIKGWNAIFGQGGQPTLVHAKWRFQLPDQPHAMWDNQLNGDNNNVPNTTRRRQATGRGQLTARLCSNMSISGFQPAV